MIQWQDLFQWDRFITPAIIKLLYWLVIALTVLFGLLGIFSGLSMMVMSPFAGFITIISSFVGIAVGVIFSRVATEFVLIVFRMNEHLGAIREQEKR